MEQASVEGDEMRALSPALSEDQFRATIYRERKRMDRSGLAMVLVVIHTDDGGRNTCNPGIWKAVDEALEAVKSDIDMLGWFERDIKKGLLVPDVDQSELAPVCDQLEISIWRELISRLDAHISSSLSVRVLRYPEPIDSQGEALLPVDSYLYPELHGGRAKTFGYEPVKRGLDIIGSLALLGLLAPILMVIALAVKLTSPGPVIFRQVRIGHMMKPFMICKFRTMQTNNHHGIHEDYVKWFITANTGGRGKESNNETVFKLTNDPRVTSIGHFLRKTSLDELPQLWNVLKGEMSLIGPRPPLRYEFQQYKPWHRHRVLEAKPGITGLWQITGRSRTTFDEMVRLDLRYARGYSLWEDIKILLATPKAVISGKGAC